jgi:hypothetical protein
MISATYGDLLPELSRVAGTTGMKVTDPRMLSMVNMAQQELMNEGAWAGVVDRWKVRFLNGNIVLPPELDMMLECTVDGVDQQIMSPWGEFVAYGPGPQEDILPRVGSRRRTWYSCAGGNIYDRGESPVYTDIPISDGSCSCDNIPVGPWNVRIYADPTGDEAPGAYATVQGLDENGLVIRTSISDGSGGSEWINGERLVISSGSGAVESLSYFSKITAFTKPRTNKYVRFTAWNGATEVQLSNYAPWETTPSYHRYFSPVLQPQPCDSRDADTCCGVVLARCRRRFVPVEENTDVLIISNILALKSMVIAQWKREAGNLDEYAAQKLTAVDLMRKESIAYTGKVRTPAMTFQRGTAIGYLSAIR